jgi:hypothetical protein
MKLKLIASVLAAGLFAVPAFGSVTILPGHETSLASILGFGSDAAVNAAQIATPPTYNTSSGSQVSTLLLEIAGNAGVNQFGIYSTADRTKTIAIFNGSATAGASAVITVTAGSIAFGGTTITGPYGFYLRNETTGTTFFSEDNKQFAFFNASSTPNYSSYLNSLIIACEDIDINSDDPNNDQDYNDMIVMVSAVPEPTTVVAGLLLLLPLGMGTFRILRQRRAA